MDIKNRGVFAWLHIRIFVFFIYITSYSLVYRHHVSQIPAASASSLDVEAAGLLEIFFFA